MAEYLKRGKSAEDVAADDKQTRDIVEGILSDVEARGDAAVRDLSVKFDNYSPERFALSQSD